MNRHRRAQKQGLAKKNQDRYDKLTPKQQLEILDKRLGKNVGAARERTKLKILLEKQRNTQSA